MIFDDFLKELICKKFYATILANTLKETLYLKRLGRQYIKETLYQCV